MSLGALKMREWKKRDKKDSQAPGALMAALIKHTILKKQLQNEYKCLKCKQ